MGCSETTPPKQELRKLFDQLVELREEHGSIVALTSRVPWGRDETIEWDCIYVVSNDVVAHLIDRRSTDGFGKRLVVSDMPDAANSVVQS